MSILQLNIQLHVAYLWLNELRISNGNDVRRARSTQNNGKWRNEKLPFGATSRMISLFTPETEPNSVFFSQSRCIVCVCECFVVKWNEPFRNYLSGMGRFDNSYWNWKSMLRLIIDSTLDCTISVSIFRALYSIGFTTFNSFSNSEKRGEIARKNNFSTFFTFYLFSINQNENAMNHRVRETVWLTVNFTSFSPCSS